MLGVAKTNPKHCRFSEPHAEQLSYSKSQSPGLTPHYSRTRNTAHSPNLTRSACRAQTLRALSNLELLLLVLTKRGENLRALSNPAVLLLVQTKPRNVRLFAPLHSMLMVSAERGKQRKPRTTALIEHVATKSQFQTAPTMPLESIATESQVQTVATLS